MVGRISSMYVFSGSALPVSTFPSSEFQMEAQSVIPGRTVRIAFSSSVYRSVNFFTSGRGPAILISRVSTLINWGNSSSLCRRKYLPIRVGNHPFRRNPSNHRNHPTIQSSVVCPLSSDLWNLAPIFSASTTMVRNLKIRKGCP